MNNIIKKTWRDSSSLILLAKQCRDGNSRQNNYDVLVQTRPAQATTFANSLVFPGGVTENVDSSSKWIQLIKSFGYTQEHFNALHQVGSIISPIFQSDPVQRHISLRITAIRETFEELGVLVCSRLKSKQRSGKWAEVITDFDVKEWQTKVSNNPEELFNLCEQLRCYPDIWGLHYWSCWMTPIPFVKRFNTAFFVAGLKEKPRKLESSSEVDHVEWSTNEAILERNHRKEILLFPPQVYELNRLAEVTDIEELLKLAAERSSFGNDLLFPVLVAASDGWLQVLPGDDLYPKSVDYNGSQLSHADITISELRSSAKTLHRFEKRETRNTFVCNYKTPHHIAMHKKQIDFNF